MSVNSSKLRVSELDFDDIKTNLKLFLNGQDTFTDYDFEGSGLNILLDTLAYNTHYLAYNLNMAVNESFLDSAVLRPSVVSQAKALGYTPRSSRSAYATVDVTLNNTTLPTATIVKGHPFKTTFDGNSFVFVTNQEYSTNVSSGILKFSNVLIYEGTPVKTDYLVNTKNLNQRFLLTDAKSDTTTLAVTVRESVTATETKTYNLATDITQIDNNSLVYFLQEVEDGYFEVYFGDGVIGKKLADGNVVTLEYIVGNEISGNDANVFTSGGSISNVSNLTVTTVATATGGAIPESIDSIKFFAPLNYSSQNRAVTAYDYRVLVPKLYANAQSVKVWGGEDNDPPTYGKIYIGIKPFSGSSLTESQKQLVVNALKDYSIISTQPVIVNPTIVSVMMNVVFRFNENLTTSTSEQLATKVRNAITNYVITDLELFEKMFRYSEVSRLIDNSDTSILSNTIRLNISTSFVPSLNTAQQYIINFQNALFNPHSGHSSVIASTPFKIAGSTSDNYLDDDGNGNIRIYSFVGTTKVYSNSLFGTVDYTTGKITITTMNVTSTTNTDGTIRILAIPASTDVLPVREQVITIDLSNILISGITDNFELSSAQSSQTGLFSTLNITTGDVFANSIVDVRNYITGSSTSSSSTSSSSSSGSSSSSSSGGSYY